MTGARPYPIIAFVDTAVSPQQCCSGLPYATYPPILVQLPPMAKLKLDLHDIYNRGDKIETELNRIIEEAVDRRIDLVEIIPGKGSGQLKKRVLRFLNQPEIRKLYHRVEKDSKNYGRIFVHFRH